MCIVGSRAFGAYEQGLLLGLPKRINLKVVTVGDYGLLRMVLKP